MPHVNLSGYALEATTEVWTSIRCENCGAGYTIRPGEAWPSQTPVPNTRCSCGLGVYIQSWSYVQVRRKAVCRHGACRNPAFLRHYGGLQVGFWCDDHWPSAPYNEED